jgi:hypothetical protein
MEFFLCFSKSLRICLKPPLLSAKKASIAAFAFIREGSVYKCLPHRDVERCQKRIWNFAVCRTPLLGALAPSGFFSAAKFKGLLRIFDYADSIEQKPTRHHKGGLLC